MKYPSGIRKKASSKAPVSYANRGMTLEEDINLTNHYYEEENIAFIYKKPTPIQINKVKYFKDGPRISDAFFKEASTTDYNGLYDGKYIDFDVKETNNKTSFSIRNIAKHQIKHLKNIDQHGGVSFLIIRFNKLNKTYLLYTKDLINYLENNEAKSIPIKVFEEKAHLLEVKYRPRLDYLKVIDESYGGTNDERKTKKKQEKF